MSPIAFDVAAGIVLAFLPIVSTTVAIHERRRGNLGGAWAYGVIAFVLCAALIAGAFDASVWR